MKLSDKEISNPEDQAQMNEEIFNEQYTAALSARDSLSVKTIASGIAACAMFVLSLFPIPSIACGITGLVLAIILFLVCLNEFSDGFISIFRFQPSNDSLNAVAVIAAAIHSTYQIFETSNSKTDISWVIYLSVFCSMLMKLLYVNEIIINLNIIKKGKMYEVSTERISLTKRYVEEVCMVNPVVNFPNVFETSCDGDPSESKSKYFVPIAAASALLISVIAAFIGGFGAFALSFAALMAIAAPFTGETSFVLPYIASQRRLRKLGSLLLGYHSINALKDVETLVVTDTELFPPKRVHINKFRFKNKTYMTEAIEYTAALLIAADAPLKKAFLKTVSCPIKRLPPVDEWRYMKNYGISANIYGDEVLLGNRNLLLSYDITPLPQETEAAMVTKNKNMLYLTVNGEIAAYILFTYNSDPAMKRAAENVGEEFNIIVETNDCTVTETMVQKRYDLQTTKIIVPDADEVKLISDIRESIAEGNNLPVMITTKNAIGILSSVKQAKNLMHIIDLSIFTKQVSVGFGLVLTTLALFLAPSFVSGLWLFAFNLLWTVPVIFLAIFGNKR